MDDLVGHVVSATVFFVFCCVSFLIQAFDIVACTEPAPPTLSFRYVREPHGYENYRKHEANGIDDEEWHDPDREAVRGP